jgi:hypothetical protein
MDESRDQGRNFAASATSAVLGAVFLIVTALATAAIVSVFTFAIAAMTVPFLPIVSAVVAASVAILLLVKFFGRCADSPKTMWIAFVRISGGVLVAFGVIALLVARSPSGAERAMAVGLGVFFILLGAVLVRTYPRVKPPGPPDETPDSD